MTEEKIDMQVVKKNNTKVILDCIRRYKLISRADISKLASLSRATVSSLVNELIIADLVVEVGSGESNSKGGKKPIILEIKEDSRLVIGIDVAENDIIRGYILNLGAKIILQTQQKYKNNSEDIIDTILNIISYLIENATNKERIVGIGIGIGALVNPQSNTILYSSNYNIAGSELYERIKNKFSLPVFIENEANAAAWGEKEYGFNNNKQNILYISKGKGIGAGNIINGEVYRGEFFGAGEIGHIIVKTNGQKCSCGLVGCLEAEAGHGVVIEKIKFKKGQIESTEIVRMYLEGENDIVEIVNESARYLGKALATFSNILNIEQIVIGGYDTNYGNNYLNEVRNEFNKNIMSYYIGKIHVNFSKFGENSVGVGAASLITKRIWEGDL